MKIQIVKTHKFKFISQSFKADYERLRVYPRFWLNKSVDTPNFKHWSLAIRWGWWYFGIERKYID